MKNKNSNRLSSIELIRIISMLMVIAFHWQLHGFNDGIIYSEISGKQVFSFAVGSWGTLGVDVFFIISSYFLLKSKNVKLRRIIPIIIKVSVYGTSVLLIATALGITKFSVIETVKSVLGVFAYQYWFLTVYVVVYCLHPIFNSVIEKIQKKYYSFVLAIMFFSTFILGFIFVNEFIGRLAAGITIYFLIGYLEKYPDNNIFKKHRYFISIAGSIGIVILECALSYIGMNYNSVANSVINRIQITQSPLMIIVGLGVFYSALNLKIKNNRVINFFGKYSVGAYLLHGGSAFIKDYLWDGLFKAGDCYQNESMFIYVIHYILCVVILFLAGVLVELVVDKMVSFLVERITQNRRIVLAQSCLENPFE